MGTGNYPLGPNPDSIEVLDYVPAGITPRPLRVTYTTDSVTDYIGLSRSGRQIILELADPLLGIVRRADKVSNLVGELKAALAAIGIEGIVDHFTSVVTEYVNHILPVDAIPGTIGLSVAAYLLRKLSESNLLLVGMIHQASIEELPNWISLIENSTEHPDIDVS